MFKHPITTPSANIKGKREGCSCDETIISLANGLFDSKEERKLVRIFF